MGSPSACLQGLDLSPKERDVAEGNRIGNFPRDSLSCLASGPSDTARKHWVKGTSFISIENLVDVAANGTIREHRDYWPPGKVWSWVEPTTLAIVRHFLQVFC